MLFVLSMFPRPRRYTSTQSLGMELFIILGRIGREEANLASTCLSPENRYDDGRPTRRPAYGGGQLTRGTMDVPLPQGKGAWTRPCWRGCSCPWGHDPLTPHSPRPAAAKPPDMGVSAGRAPLQKAGLKRINFRYGPAGPVHFFPHITEVHGGHRLAWTPGDRAWRKLPAPAQTLQFAFL